MLQGAKIIRKEKQAPRPLPLLSSAPPPAPVCLRLSVSTSSCKAHQLLLYGTIKAIGTLLGDI